MYHKAPLQRKKSSMTLGAAVSTAGSQCGDREQGHRLKEAEEWTQDLSTASALSGIAMRKELASADKCLSRCCETDKVSEIGH